MLHRWGGGRQTGWKEYLLPILKSGLEKELGGTLGVIFNHAPPCSLQMGKPRQTGTSGLPFIIRVKMGGHGQALARCLYWWGHLS